MKSMTTQQAIRQIRKQAILENWSNPQTRLAVTREFKKFHRRFWFVRIFLSEPVQRMSQILQPGSLQNLESREFDAIIPRLDKDLAYRVRDRARLPFHPLTDALLLQGILKRIRDVGGILLTR